MAIMVFVLWGIGYEIGEVTKQLKRLADAAEQRKDDGR